MRGFRRLFGLSTVFCFAALLAPQSHSAIIHVTTDITGGVSQIEQGQTVIVNVRAFIENAAGPNDGIFTFDEDLILANLINNEPSILAFQSLTRPNVSDQLFGGSDGTVTPAGVQSIYGGYLADTAGIGSPTLLFSVALKGIDVGTESITPGPSTNPYGFDFLLYQSAIADTSVTYDNGATLQVIAAGNGGSGGTGGNGGNGGGGSGGTQVPLPSGAMCGVLGALVAWPVARRRIQRS
jgi:hypothetical protein